MEDLNGNYYVEVKDHRYKIHPTEIIILRLRDELNIKFKMRLRLGNIKKLLKTMEN